MHCDMSESSAGARKGGGVDWKTGWTYRVGVELAEAHCAGFNEDVRDCSVPSSAGYMVLGEGGECCGG